MPNFAAIGPFGAEIWRVASEAPPPPPPTSHNEAQNSPVQLGLMAHYDTSELRKKMCFTDFFPSLIILTLRCWDLWWSTHCFLSFHKNLSIQIQHLEIFSFDTVFVLLLVLTRPSLCIVINVDSYLVAMEAVVVSILHLYFICVKFHTPNPSVGCNVIIWNRS